MQFTANNLNYFFENELGYIFISVALKRIFISIKKEKFLIHLYF